MLGVAVRPSQCFPVDELELLLILLPCVWVFVYIGQRLASGVPYFTLFSNL